MSGRLPGAEKPVWVPVEKYGLLLGHQAEETLWRIEEQAHSPNLERPPENCKQGELLPSRGNLWFCRRAK